MHKPSPTQAGGVGIYVRNDIKVKRNDYFNLNLEGCEDLWIDVELNQAGGVGIYVRNDIKVKRNDYFNLNLEGCEDLWIDVELNCSKNQYLFGVIYRHPNSKINDFLQELNTKLSLITQKNKKSVIMGDININLIEKNRQTVDYRAYFNDFLLGGQFHTTGI